MFIYLNKKIAIPNNTKLNCLAWNKEQGYIAVGGNDGMLKVLKLDPGDAKMKGLAAPSNLSMNQTLEGHSGEVQVIVWNEIHQKLTSSDQYGLIIVWMLYKGSWYEEMINNRNKSVVKGMSWSSDGQKICIVYEDGAIIVGSVDGNRIWGKEMKNISLNSVQWSPNGKNLLFGLQNGEIHIFDNQGNFTTKLNVQFSSFALPVNKAAVTLDWYDGKQGYIDENCPSLAICFNNGHLQLMRNEYDDNPVIIDTGMKAVCCKWNHNGSTIAIVGTMILSNENKKCNVIQFFSPFGEHIRTLKVPGENVTCCAWENNSLRIALAVDSHIYFANIHPDYKWTSINYGRIIVYSYNSPSKHTTSICFWDTKKNETHIKDVSGLLNLAAWNSYCVAALRIDDKKFKLLLFNSIATLIDTKEIEIEPLWLSINSSHVFVASKNNFAIWSFKIPKLHSAVHSAYRRIRSYHIDDIPCGVSDVIQDLDANYTPTKDAFPTSDPICCITASDKILLIGRESGSIQQYSLPHVTLVQRYSVHSRPYAISLNCDSTKCALIDISGVLSFRTVEESCEFSLKSRTEVDENLKTERRDVWALCWASDNPSFLATMEKTRMYILRNDEPEEPIVSAGYVCSFRDLKVRSILLDEIMKNPEQPTSEQILDLEVKSLRDTRELLDKVGITETINFIEDNSHPVLWKLLAESALKKLDLTTAESAFVRYSNIQGLNLVKRLQNIQSDNLRRAEIMAYLGDYDETEKIYLEMERIDLAIQLRERLGDWFRVSQLMKFGITGSDIQYEKTWNSIGDYYFERQNWKSAQEYYEKSKNIEKELICAYMMEDWESLKTLVTSLNKNHPLLYKIGVMLTNVGICKDAVDIFIKAGNVKKAIESCISLTQWSEAIRLGIKHQYPGVSKLLASNAKQLIDSDKILEAIDFLIRAQQYIEAAKLMFLVAKEEEIKKKNPVYIKKLYVLAALIIEERQKVNVEEFSSTIDPDTSRGMLMEPWRKAEAYHFLMTAQRQLYQGYVDAAMRTSLFLKNYENILEPELIYSLIVLASAASHHYATCSRALCQLQALSTLSNDKKEAYEALALDLFSRNSPRDAKISRIQCPTCGTLISSLKDSCQSCKTKFPICIITGSPLYEANPWTCSVCHHKASSHDAALRQSCALCHSPTQYHSLTTIKSNKKTLTEKI